ncbi:MAG: glycosyltransferase family 2 protein [Methylocystis silviterrae]|uniref:glycosyltransferase family 2 protein n=1 Tax=Methylocystis silviterrae TaxID=2743612 RepID=UPI003C785CF8
MISVLILTFNEAANIADCLASLPWRDDVHVLDSASTDGTAAIAETAGARVHVRPFTNYAEQRNFGLALPFGNEWIVSLDADERMTPALAREIEHAIGVASTATALFRVRRKDMFIGRWLRRSSGYPTWFPRIFRRGHVRVKREVNEEYVAEGEVRALREHILHFPFNKGLEWWFERHNRYSTMEAATLTAERSSRAIRASDVLSADAGSRRSALKQIAYRFPGRPFLIFLYLYVFRLGFLDGRAGFHFASMRLAYEVMIDAKLAHCKHLVTAAYREPGECD